MGRGNGKSGAGALDKLTAVKQDLLKRMTEAIEPKDFTHLSEAYENLCRAEHQEIRNLEAFLDLENRRSSGYNPYAPYMTATGLAQFNNQV